MSLNARGSQSANEWAQKRREQVEKAKMVREERKNGSTSSSNALQGAGQEFVHRTNSNNGRSQQHTPIAHQEISSPGQYNNYRQYPVSQDPMELPLRNGNYQQQYKPMQPQNYQHSAAPRTQDNYYPPKQSYHPPMQLPGIGQGLRSTLADSMNTIQYEQRASQYNQPSQHMMPNRSSFGDQQTMTTNYSSQDHKDAQGCLQLLKKRMTSRDQPFESGPKSTGGRFAPAQNFQHVPKPPRASQQQLFDAEEPAFENKNYRKVFNPEQQQMQQRIQPQDRQTYQPEKKELPVRQIKEQVSQSKQIPYKPTQPQKQKQQEFYEPPAYQSATYDPPAYAGSGFQNAEQPDEYGEVGRLIECDDCGRKFNEQAIVKHRKVCRKVFVEKRKAFDIAEQRKATDATGKGLEEDPYSKKRQQKQTKPEPVKQEGKIPKWKLQSMQLRKGIGAVPEKAAYGDVQGLKMQQALEEASDDRILCKFCGRKFNDNAAERHIAFCETKTRKDQMKTGGKPAPVQNKPNPRVMGSKR